MFKRPFDGSCMGPFLVLFTLIILSFSPSSAQSERSAKIKDVRKYGQGELRIIEGIPFLRLSGSYYDMGRQYGVLLKDEFHKIYHELLPYKSAILANQPSDWLRQLEELTPEKYVQQIRGMSDGSWVPYEDLLLAAYFGVLERGGCSSILAKISDKNTPRLIHGRNLDYGKGTGRYPVVIDYQPALEGCIGYDRENLHVRNSQKSPLASGRVVVPCADRILWSGDRVCRIRGGNGRASDYPDGGPAEGVMVARRGARHRPRPHAEAAALARTRGSTDPAAAVVLARLAIANGRYEEALVSLQTVATASPSRDAALELGLLQLRLGRKGEAERTLTPIVAEAGSLKSPEARLRAARAARALGQFRTANTLFREAAASAPSDPEINTAWGELFFERHDPREAARSFGDALKQDEQWAPAHLGLARALAGESEWLFLQG